VEKFAVVDMLETTEDLEQDALDTGGVHWLVVACLHQLVEVAVHELHCDVKPAAVRVQEDVQGRYEMRVRW
jgi:hypothetical protein